MTHPDCCRCSSRSCVEPRRYSRASRGDAATNGSACPVIADIEEERMLRALVSEGLAVARHEPFVACFRGWRVRVSQGGRFGAGRPTATVEIHCPQHAASGPACRFLLCDQTVFG